MTDSHEAPGDTPEGWVRHYMTIPADVLAQEYISREVRPNRTVPPEMEAAVQDRIEEMEEALA